MTPPAEPTPIAAWLGDKRVLIADPSAGARAALAKAMKELGAKTPNLVLVSSFGEAGKELGKAPTQIVICDYHLDSGRNGLELMAKFRAQAADTAGRLFVLATGNSRESVIAEAAEEEVDGYILKPLTAASVLEYLTRAIMAKVQPSPYRKSIDEGRADLEQGRLQQAETRFQDALPLSPKPSLAYYYLGQVAVAGGDYAKAGERFESGLSHQSFHYRCLSGQFDLMLMQKRHDEAYAVGKRIAAFFPLSAQRLDAILRLAVRTGTYVDVSHYYDLYTHVETRSPELTKCMAAALVVAGKHSMASGAHAQALEHFRRGISVSSRAAGVIREAVISLCEGGRHSDADALVREYPPELQTSPGYQALDLLVSEGIGKPSQVIDRARRLVQDQVNDPIIYEVLVRRSVQAGLTRAAEDAIDQAVRLWPDSKARFQRLLKPSASPAAEASASAED